MKIHLMLTIEESLINKLNSLSREEMPSKSSLIESLIKNYFETKDSLQNNKK